MSYCTQTDLTDRYGLERIAELTRDATGSTVDADLATDAIEAIGAKIDAALRVNYNPADYDATNELLNDLAIEGAYLYLVKWSPGGFDGDSRDDWKMIVKELENISLGRIILKTETDQQKEDRIDGFFSSDTRLFRRSRNTLSDLGLCSQ